jgi:hypothetical protein
MTSRRHVPSFFEVEEEERPAHSIGYRTCATERKVLLHLYGLWPLEYYALSSRTLNVCNHRWRSDFNFSETAASAGPLWAGAGDCGA